MDTNKWELNKETRERIVDKIVGILKKHTAQTNPDGMNELKNIALRFEEKIYTGAANQKDYLQRISEKMLLLETKGSSSAGNHSATTSAGNNQNGIDPGEDEYKKKLIFDRDDWFY